MGWGSLATLAVYAGIALGALFAVHEFLGYEQGVGASRQLAVDQKVVAAKDAIIADLQQKGAQRTAERDSCLATVTTQTTATDALHTLGIQIHDGITTVQAAVKAQGALNAAKVSGLQGILTGPPAPNQTCQQQLLAVDQILRAAARGRVAP